jgi:hypothetical protein
VGRIRPLGAPAAALVAVVLLVDAALGLVADVDDHTRGAGLVSEVLFALAVLLVAIVVAAVQACQARPPQGWADRLAWAGHWLAVVALVLAAIVALSVPIRGEEPPDAVSTPVVLGALLGLLAFGIAAAVIRVVPWWAGLVVAFFFPVLFLGGAVGALVVAAAWLLVAWALHRAPAPAAK